MLSIVAIPVTRECEKVDEFAKMVRRASLKRAGYFEPNYTFSAASFSHAYKFSSYF